MFTFVLIVDGPRECINSNVHHLYRFISETCFPRQHVLSLLITCVESEKKNNHNYRFNFKTHARAREIYIIINIIKYVPTKSRDFCKLV